MKGPQSRLQALIAFPGVAGPRGALHRLVPGCDQPTTLSSHQVVRFLDGQASGGHAR
eukprot:SAG31_NODE_721_length_12587_cov_5.502002_14_plen_57_part_00